jgi:hypothetical protein
MKKIFIFFINSLKFIFENLKKIFSILIQKLNNFILMLNIDKDFLFLLFINIFSSICFLFTWLFISPDIFLSFFDDLVDTYFSLKLINLSLSNYLIYFRYFFFLIIILFKISLPFLLPFFILIILIYFFKG